MLSVSKEEIENDAICPTETFLHLVFAAAVSGLPTRR
jgi:hypothetical protein